MCMPLSVEAVESSLAPAPEQNARSGRKTMSSRTGVISPTVVVEPLPTNSGGGGGGGGVTPAGRDDAMKISAIRPLSVEAVESSLAQAPEQNARSGRKTMSSRTGVISPTVVVEPPPPLPTAGGGGCSRR